MPFFHRFFFLINMRSFYYRKRSSASPYRSWRSSFVRRGTASSRTFNVTIPAQASFNMTVANPAFWSNLVAISPYFATGNGASASRCYASLLTSLLYRTYAQIYDEVKINSCYARITIMNNIGTGGIVPALKLVTMWDRKANADELVAGNGLPGTSDMQVGSESQVSLIVNNSRAVVSRYIKATDLQERTFYHDCSWIQLGTSQRWYDKMFYDPNLSGVAATTDVGFCPALFVALNTASSPAEGTPYVFTVAVDVRWNVTFRNPKFGLSAAAASGAKLSSGEKFTQIREVVVDEAAEQAADEDKGREVEVLKDDDGTLIDDDEDMEESQKEPTKEELLEMLAKLKKES